jgi:hypothetical protein
VVPKLQGFNIEVQTLLPREKSRPLVKGWGVGCVATTIITRQLCPHLMLMYIGRFSVAGMRMRRPSPQEINIETLNSDLR